MQGFLIHFLVKQNFCLMIDKWDVTIYFFNITCHSNSFLRPTTKQNTEECIDSVYCLFIINACMFQSYSHLSGLIYTASCLMYNALCHPHLTHLVDSNYRTCHIRTLYYIHILIQWSYTLYQTSATYNEATNMATIFPIGFLYLKFYY